MEERELITSNDIKVSPEKIIANALKNGLPLAIWRKPLSDLFCISISYSKDTGINDKSIEELENGFVFSPFINSKVNKTHFIHNDLFIKVENDQINEIVNAGNQSNIDLENKLMDEQEYHSFYPNLSIQLDDIHVSKEEYINYVSNAIDAISNGHFEKVVPSRKTNIKLPGNFNAFQFFKKLEKSYPNAFIYLVSIPETGTWLGATPENLISIQDNKIFKTTALAGTQQYEDGMDLTDAAWRQKEIEEQALVSRYIINCFKKIRLREFEERGPKTIKAGNLMHLKTDFIVDMEEVNFPQLGSVMLDLLHPTSAICGMPKIPSMEFIQQHEGFDRGYFSGYLGPVNTENSTDIFVNLRCMTLVDQQTAEIFAGAGVTVDSKPEKEWLETEMKMETLLKLM